MKKEIQKIGEREFETFDDANRCYCEREADGFAYVCMTYNTPKAGMYTVRWGIYVESEDQPTYEIRMLAKIFRERDDEASAQFNKECEVVGRTNAAHQIAAAAGYTGRDAEIFVSGFCGSSAKIVNPRAEGREHIFRAGRVAWGSNNGQRTWRVESVKARTVVRLVVATPLAYGGLIANGEY